MSRPHHSPWFQGLLDREAGCALEPQDWDIDYPPCWWRQYEQGVRDFDSHQKLVRAAALVDARSESYRLFIKGCEARRG